MRSRKAATATLKIGVLTLDIQPSTVVPGQQITIQGSGFVRGDEFHSVVVEGTTVTLSPEAEASSAGDIVITINVPSSGTGIGHGTKTVSVTASGSNRIGEGKIEVPEASITLSPTESRRGETVNASGTGFPAGDLVQIKYERGDDLTTVAAGSADASGAVNIDFIVPSYANIGSEHDVEAVSIGVYASVTAEATHTTPGAAVTLSSTTISSGESITITGMNFPAFATVAEMMIGGVDVRPVPAPATSIDGDFSTTVLVPQLELGNQTVSIRVSQTTVTTFLNIGTVAESQHPADLFADLIEAGALDRIFLYDNDRPDLVPLRSGPRIRGRQQPGDVGTRRHHLDPAQGSRRGTGREPPRWLEPDHRPVGPGQPRTWRGSRPGANRDGFPIPTGRAEGPPASVSETRRTE